MKVMRYLQRTKYFMLLSSSDDLLIVRYTDSDFAGSLDDLKSTLGYVFKMNDGAISWNLLSRL